MSIETVTPPPAKAAPALEPVAPVSPTPATITPEPKPVERGEGTPSPTKQEAREIGKKQPPRSRITEIAAKLEAAAQGKKIETADEVKRDEGVAAPKDEGATKKEDAIPSGDKELDAEIETHTKDLTPAQKKAFAHKTYAVRDLTRKLAAAEEAGKKTTAIEEKLTKAEAALTEAQAKAAEPKADPKELEDLKTQAEAAAKRAQELEQELQVAAVERSPEFQAAIIKPKQTIEEAVKALAKKHDLPERQLLHALYAGEDEQATAIEALTDVEKVRFFNYSLKIADIDANADVLRQNAAEANVKIAAKREQETKAQAETRKTAFAQAHTQNWKSITDALPFLKPGDGDDDVTKNWNSHYNNAEQNSRSTDLGALEPAQQSEVSIRAHLFPMVVGALQSKDTEITDLTTKLTEANEALQKFRDNKPGAEATAREEGVVEKPKGTMAERIGRKVGQLTGR